MPPNKDRTFHVKLNPAQLPADSSIAGVLQSDATNLDSFLKDVGRLPEIYFDTMEENRSLVSQIEGLGAEEKLAEKAEPGRAKDEADALVEKLRLEKQASEKQVLDDFKKIWVKAFSPEGVFHFLAQMPATTIERIIEKIKEGKSEQTIGMLDMNMHMMQRVIAIKRSIEKTMEAQHALSIEKTGGAHSNVTLASIQETDGVIAQLKEMLAKEIEEIRPEMDKIYGRYDPGVQQQFQTLLADLAMPQAFAVLPTAVFKDILTPQMTRTHFIVDQNCSNTQYLFASSANSKVVDIKVHMEVYATRYIDEEELSFSSGKQITAVSGAKRKPEMGDYRLFQQGKEVWADAAEFKAIQKSNFKGYDKILTVETHHKATSLAYSTPVSVSVTQHVDVPLEKKFLKKVKAKEIPNMKRDHERSVSSTPSSSSLPSLDSSGYGSANSNFSSRSNSDSSLPLADSRPPSPPLPVTPAQRLGKLGNSRQRTESGAPTTVEVIKPNAHKP